MFPVANDFAAIAKRLKEIQAEVAAESAAAEASRRCKTDCPVGSQDEHENIEACA